MNNQQTQTDIKNALRSLGIKKNRLYKPVLTEILSEFANLDSLKGKRILELGPGHHLELAQGLTRYAEVSAVGLSQHVTNPPVWLEEKEIYDYLISCKENSFDIIYSRRVMEQNSFEPGLLIQQEFYYKLIREGATKAEMVNYPGSRLNLIRNYIEVQKVLKLGGIVISHVGNRRMANFHDQHLHKLGMEKVRTYPIGLLGQMWVFRKISNQINLPAGT